MATDKQKSGKKKKGLWKRLKKTVCKATKFNAENKSEEHIPFIQKSASSVELAKKQKAQKRKKSLKKLKQYTVSACRYIGIGAALSAHGYGQGGYPMYPDFNNGRTDYYGYGF